MPRDQYFDRSGAAIGLDQWSALFADESYRHVGRTTIMNAHHLGQIVHVYTVWVGVDQSFGTGVPQIYETLLDASDDVTDESAVVERYGSESAAQAGHRRHVVQQAAQVSEPIITDLDP